MAKKKIVDWEKLKIEYVTGHISQRELAAKHGVPYSTLRQRSIREQWVKEKEQHSRTVVANAQKKIGEKQADLLAREYQIATDFVKLIEKSLTDENNYDEAFISFGDVVKTGRIDSKALLNAANALQKFMDIRRVCKGHQTVQEKQQYDLALKRLEIEEARANKDEVKDTDYNITLGSEEIKRWSK